MAVNYLQKFIESHKSTLPDIKVKEVFVNPIFNITEQRNRINLELFEHHPLLTVQTADIIPTQTKLYIGSLKMTTGIGNETGAYLLSTGGKYYILDGHHRIANRILQGYSTISAHVLIID